MCSHPRRQARDTTALAAIVLPALTPEPSRAIQLRWSGGASETSVTANSRCMLVVQAEFAEATQPSWWQLQWVVDSSGVQR